jgi:hypothetical protein
MACGENEFVPQRTGSEYFPVQKGLSWIYKVNETIYSEVAQPQVKDYRLKIEIVDSVLNPTGTYTYIVHRSVQALQDVTWSSLDTWSIRKSDTDVIVYEGNTGFRKLIFPIREGLEWNGNQYNALGEDQYSMTVAEALDVGGTSFEDVLKVEQEMNEDFIVFLDEREESYARNVGLIRQSLKQLNYCTLDNCVGQQKIKSGRVYLQELISYAKN